VEIQILLNSVHSSLLTVHNIRDITKIIFTKSLQRTEYRISNPKYAFVLYSLPTPTLSLVTARPTADCTSTSVRCDSAWIG